MADDVTNPDSAVTTEATNESAATPAADPTQGAAALEDGGILTPPVEGDVGATAADAAADGAADVPGAPEAYELTMPEGIQLDTAAMTIAEPVLRDLNLNNEQASKLAAIVPTLAQHYAKQAQDATINEVIALRKEWATAAMSDPEYGGANLDRSRADAARFMDKLGRPGLRQTLEESGYTNHPDMLAAFAFAGRLLSEDQDFARGAPVPKPQSREERYYPAAS